MAVKRRSAPKRDKSNVIVDASDKKALDAVRARARKDPVWFAQKFVKTQDPQATDPIRPWPDYGYLNKVLMAFVKAVILVVKKSRQMLLSWAICVYSIWLTGLRSNRQVMIQSEKEDKSVALIERCRFILGHIPGWLWGCDVQIGAQRITFSHADGESWIMAVPSGEDQIRSFSPTCVIFDESAWQKRIKAAHEAALPAVRSGGQIIHVSSPGMADRKEQEFFKWLVEEFDLGQKIVLHYSEIPGYTPEWAADIKKRFGYSAETWEREMEGNMGIGSGVPVFKPPFNRATHICPLGYNRTLPLVRAWDYGIRYAACLWMQIHPKTRQLLILDSVTTQDMALSQHILYCLRRQAMIPNMVDLPVEMIHDYDDPAGQARKDTGPSSRYVMNQMKIYPRSSSKKVPIDPSIMLIRERLQPQMGLDMLVRPGILFDPRCQHILEAFDGMFVTAEDKEDKFSGGICEHEVDCLRYAVAGEFRLLG